MRDAPIAECREATCRAARRRAQDRRLRAALHLRAARRPRRHARLARRHAPAPARAAARRSSASTTRCSPSRRPAPSSSSTSTSCATAGVRATPSAGCGVCALRRMCPLAARIALTTASGAERHERPIVSRPQEPRAARRARYPRCPSPSCARSRAADPARLRPAAAAPRGRRGREGRAADGAVSRWFYAEVGRRPPLDRPPPALGGEWQDWADRVETWVATVAGERAGYYELRAERGAVEVAYFGLRARLPRTRARRPPAHPRAAARLRARAAGLASHLHARRPRGAAQLPGARAAPVQDADAVRAGPRGPAPQRCAPYTPMCGAPSRRPARATAPTATVASSAASASAAICQPLASSDDAFVCAAA